MSEMATAWLMLIAACLAPAVIAFVVDPERFPADGQPAPVWIHMLAVGMMGVLAIFCLAGATSM